MGLWMTVNLLIEEVDRADFAEDRQEAADALGIDSWEDRDAEAIRRRALVVAEEELGLTEAERRWLSRSLTSPRPGSIPGPALSWNTLQSSEHRPPSWPARGEAIASGSCRRSGRARERGPGQSVQSLASSATGGGEECRNRSFLRLHPEVGGSGGSAPQGGSASAACC
jgi:hypothetical protein